MKVLLYCSVSFIIGMIFGYLLVHYDRYKK